MDFNPLKIGSCMPIPSGWFNIVAMDFNPWEMDFNPWEMVKFGSNGF